MFGVRLPFQLALVFTVTVLVAAKVWPEDQVSRVVLPYCPPSEHVLRFRSVDYLHFLKKETSCVWI